MINPFKPVVLCVDDDEEILNLLRIFLESKYYVISTKDGNNALNQVLMRSKPDLILLDIMMADIDGFAVCDRLQQQSDTASIPIVFMSSLDKNATVGKAYQAGAVDYLLKPFTRKEVLELVAKYIETPLYLHRRSTVPAAKKAGTSILGFLSFLADNAGVALEHKHLLENTAIEDIYSTSSKLGLKSSLVAKALAEYTGFPFMPLLNPDLIVFHDQHTTQEQLVLREQDKGKKVLVVSNPLVGSDSESSFPDKAVTTPENIARLHEMDSIDYLCEQMLYLIREQQGYAVIEPHGDSYTIRVLSETGTEAVSAITVSGDTAQRLVLACKKLAGLPDSQSGQPETAGFAQEIAGTTGEYLLTTNLSKQDKLEIKHINRITMSVSSQEKLLSAEQDRLLQHYARTKMGLILIVGPDRSGKSITASNILGHARGREIITVEKTARVSLESAKQLLVDEVAGDTFERLLKHAIAQQPDIVYADSLDSYYSARVITEFVKRGNLAIARLTAVTPAEAIKALEKLGLSRLDIANNLICIVHQATTRKLCSYCKQVHLPTEQEISALTRYTTRLPEKTATSFKCSKCDYTGFKGRQCFLNVIAVDSDVRRQIQSLGMERYNSEVARQALSNVTDLTITVGDACQDILVKLEAPAAIRPESAELLRSRTILVVDDDDDHNSLLKRYLQSSYNVICANDGVEALLLLNKNQVDLMLVDIQMPAMDGFTLTEISKGVGLDIPVIFVSGKNSEHAVIKGLIVGAADYVVKPVKKEVLLKKVAAILKPTAQA